MKRGLAALATGAFALGFAEFVMMGILPVVASGLNVTEAWAGNFISLYAIGVCAGAVILVLGRRVPPRTLLVALMVLCLVGNVLAAISGDANMLLVARFISGMPHGAYFGTATLAAKMIAEPGREGRAVAGMVLGQTLANTLGVPAGTLLASLVSWHAAFAFAAICALAAIVLIARWVPQLDSIPDAGLLGQFRFLSKPGPWLVIIAVLLGNTGIFCWWSYVSPWLTSVAGFSAVAIPAMLVLAGAGMVVGVQAGGRLGDVFTPGSAAAAGQLAAAVALGFIALGIGSPVVSAALMFLCAGCMFFVSGPQQVLMVEAGEGGGELLAGACVQIAFNGGNALGAQVGQTVLNMGAAYGMTGLAGVPFSIVAAALLALFAWKLERAQHDRAVGRTH